MAQSKGNMDAKKIVVFLSCVKTYKKVSLQKRILFPMPLMYVKEKQAQIASMKIRGLKISQLAVRTAPAQLLVILLGVNVNVLMLQYGC